MISAPIARVGLRYFAMLLMAKGYFSQEAADAIIADRDLQQLVEMGVGAVISVAVEIYYKVALKRGWPT